MASVRCNGPCCDAVLRSVLEYTVAFLDITPFLPICLVKYIERVQMRALRIIYLWKPYNLLKSLDLRTGALRSAGALWKYLQKAGLCQPLIKHLLSIYFIFNYLFNIHSIFQCLKTGIKNSYRSIKHFYLNCSLRTLEMAFMRELPPYPGSSGSFLVLGRSNQFF